VKKVFAKSTTEKCVVSGGINNNMVYGLDTSGACWYTAAFTAFRSYTNLHSVGRPSSQIFLTGKIGVRTGESHCTITPDFSNGSNTGVMPFIASFFKEYCFKHGLYSDLGHTTKGSAPFMSPTLYLGEAHNEDRTSDNSGNVFCFNQCKQINASHLFLHELY